jgi:RNA polymerase sigma-70 factor (ECF subfamily)
LTQETFLRVWSRADTYRPGTVQFTTWLHRIAHNLCMDELRRVRPESLDEPDRQLSEFADPEQATADREIAARLDRALGALPQTQRAALLLTEVQGLSNQQVADIMNLGVRAVESLLARARRTLRERVLEP